MLEFRKSEILPGRCWESNSKNNEILCNCSALIMDFIVWDLCHGKDSRQRRAWQIHFQTKKILLENWRVLWFKQKGKKMQVWQALFVIKLFSAKSQPHWDVFFMPFCWLAMDEIISMNSEICGEIALMFKV